MIGESGSRSYSRSGRLDMDCCCGFFVEGELGVADSYYVGREFLEQLEGCAGHQAEGHELAALVCRGGFQRDDFCGLARAEAGERNRLPLSVLNFQLSCWSTWK